MWTVGVGARACLRSTIASAMSPSRELDASVAVAVSCRGILERYNGELSRTMSWTALCRDVCERQNRPGSAQCTVQNQTEELESAVLRQIVSGESTGDSESCV
eukprot:2757673-Rhodomonas_salina.1